MRSGERATTDLGAGLALTDLAWENAADEKCNRVMMVNNFTNSCFVIINIGFKHVNSEGSFMIFDTMSTIQ